MYGSDRVELAFLSRDPSLRSAPSRGGGRDQPIKNSNLIFIHTTAVKPHLVAVIRQTVRACIANMLFRHYASAVG